MLFMITPPGQPLNLPQVNINHFNLPQKVLDYFDPGLTSGVSREAATITGFWYKFLDIKFGLYFPTQMINSSGWESFQDGPQNPLFGLRIKNLKLIRINVLNKQLAIILQLLRQTFSYYLKGKITPLNFKIDASNYIDSFFTEWVTYPISQLSTPIVPTQDSVNIYSFDTLIKDRTLKNDQRIENWISYLNQKTTGIIRNNKVWLYNKNFYNSMKFFIKNYINITKTELDGTFLLYDHLIDIFKTVKDFIKNPMEKIFISWERLNLWLKTHDEARKTRIESKFDISKNIEQDRYYYMNSDGKLYMVQNVKNGSLDRAFRVAITWHQSKINLGKNAQKYVGDIPFHVIYGVDLENMLRPIKDNSSVQSHQTENEGDYLQLLSYRTNNFAALLPMW